MAELDAFFRRCRDQQEYARYFLLPEERLLYGLWLLRHAIQRPHTVLMFVARGAEPIREAWNILGSRFGRTLTLPDSFSVRIYRGYRHDTEPDGEPTHFLSRSILSALTDAERDGVVPRHVWDEVEQASESAGLRGDLDRYLRDQWGIQDGLCSISSSSFTTLETALTCLADFGIDRSYRKLIWRNRHARFGTDVVAPLLSGHNATVSALAHSVRSINDRLGLTFEAEDILNMEAGLVPLTDASGVLPERCRELVSSVMRIYLNARLMKRLRHNTEHRARPLLNILLRSTAVGQLLTRPSTRAVASVDEATVSGTSLIAAELSALSFNGSLQYESLNIAQRTLSTAAYVLDEGIVDACAIGGIWLQEDMSQLYGGYYRANMRYTTFRELAGQLSAAQDRVCSDRDACRAMLEKLNRRLQSFATTLMCEMPVRDSGADVRPRYPIEVILAHFIKLHFRRHDATSVEYQKMVLDDDVLQVVSPLQCDFTGWFFLRHLRQRVLEWLGENEHRYPELSELQQADERVRNLELSEYFSALADRHDKEVREIDAAAETLDAACRAPVTAFLRGETSFDSLRIAFYESFRQSKVSTAVSM